MSEDERTAAQTPVCRFWRWVAVFACARLNARLWDEQCTYVVTQTGEPRG